MVIDMLKVEENGKQVVLKKNIDFFELKDGTFYTVEALAKKYDTATNTIYKKAKDYDIDKVSIAGYTCFKDDLRFEKQKGNHSADVTNMRQLVSYPQLHDKVAEAIGEMFAARGEYQAFMKNQTLWNNRFENELIELQKRVDLILEHLTADKQQPGVNG